jgi:hypothetical protein
MYETTIVADFVLLAAAISLMIAQIIAHELKISQKKYPSKGKFHKIIS